MSVAKLEADYMGLVTNGDVLDRSNMSRQQIAEAESKLAESRRAIARSIQLAESPGYAKLLVETEQERERTVHPGKTVR